MSRKANILAAATALFRTQGKDRTSIRQIAGEADVSHSLLHKHWDSKDSLYLECVSIEVLRLRSIIGDCNRVESTVYYLLKHPTYWTLVARCLSAPPPTTGEEKRMASKCQSLVRPLLDDMMELTKKFSSRTSDSIDQATECQASVAWFFVMTCIFSGHSLLRTNLEAYMGEPALHIARRTTIDAFYENWIFKPEQPR